MLYSCVVFVQTCVLFTLQNLIFCKVINRLIIIQEIVNCVRIGDKTSHKQVKSDVLCNTATC